MIRSVKLILCSPAERGAPVSSSEAQKMWTPPDEPNPQAVLDSALSDTRAGLHAQALAKFLWFHHNALRYQSSLYGVRLSFALSYWTELAAVYPPARAAFIRTRDETEAAFRADRSNFERFHDLASLNQYLGEGTRTANLFVDIARIDRALAQQLYSVAEPFLIAVGRYDACGPFLDPSTQLGLAADSYKVLRELEEEQPEGEIQPPKAARLFYVRDIATLVGLLVLNHRTEEAGRAREQALTVLDDEEFRTLLDAAMSGHLPPPLFD
jgi:hypothetical protein